MVKVIDRSTDKVLGTLTGVSDTHYTYRYTSKGVARFALARLDRSSLEASA